MEVSNIKMSLGVAAGLLVATAPGIAFYVQAQDFKDSFDNTFLPKLEKWQEDTSKVIEDHGTKLTSIDVHLQHLNDTMREFRGMYVLKPEFSALESRVRRLEDREDRGGK